MPRLILLLSFLMLAILFLGNVPVANGQEQVDTRADITYYDLEVKFESITLFEVIYKQHLAGSDASILRTALDTNETYGNKNGEVDFFEVASLIEDLKGEGADINHKADIKLGEGSYVSGLSQEVEIIGAEGPLLNNPDPIDFNAYIDVELYIKANVAELPMILEINDAEAPRTFFLTMPNGYPMNLTTFEPKAFTSYSSPYHINLTETDANSIGYLLLDPVQVGVLNTAYVPPIPDPPVDDDEDDEEDDSDDEEESYLLYFVLIGVGVVMIIIIVILYRNKEKQDMEEEQREKVESEIVEELKEK